MSLLQVKGLVKYYGSRPVVNGVDFEVSKGEVVGLLGPNGAGKTTSFKMATGNVAPSQGTVWFNDVDVTHLAMYERARLGMGYLSQEQSIFRKLNVEQNILAILELMPYLRTLGRALTRAERYERTDAVIKRFGLNHVRKNNAARLSGGEKRRLEIARCLVCEPLLILLDEPFTGIDPITIAEIRQIIFELRNEGIGLLLTDHNVHEALKITTRSYLIKDGKVRTHGTPAQIVRDPIAISEYLGAGFSDNNYRGLDEHVRAAQVPPPVAAPVADAPGSPKTLTPVANAPGSAKTLTPVADAPGSPKTLTPVANAPGSAKTLTPVADAPGSPTLEFAPKAKVPAILEQEKIQRLVENLKTADQPRAAEELAKRGMHAIPALLNALERRDAELRQKAVDVLQAILSHPIPFDSFAPEAARKAQLAALRDLFERKAG